jgi:hypothetical protein
MAFLYAGGVIVPDQNLGKVEISYNTGESGAIQITGVMRLNRDEYDPNGNLLACQALEDRFLQSVESIGSVVTTQEALGYLPCNFLNPAEILMVA